MSLVVLGAMGATGWLGLRVFDRARALSTALDKASTAFANTGFALVASSSLVDPHKLHVQAPALTCFVAVTSAPTGDMVVSHGSSMASHPHSIGWCACDPEPVTVTAPEGSGPAQGVRLYGIDARVLGGPQGWGLARARPEAVTGGGDECQESVLVSWIADRRFPRETVDAGWLERGAGAHLSEAGFKPVSGSSRGRTFAVVEPMPGNCMLALHPDAPSSPDPLVLEDGGGAVLARGGALMWCDLHGRSLTVRTNGNAVVLVVAAPAARIGGLLGTREWAARAHVPESDHLRERGRPYARRHGVSHGERAPRRRPRPAGNANALRGSIASDNGGPRSRRSSPRDTPRMLPVARIGQARVGLRAGWSTAVARGRGRDSWIGWWPDTLLVGGARR